MAIELEQSQFEFKPGRDQRQRMEEPLPVELEAVADVHLPSPRVPTVKLDVLYVTILEFAAIHDDHYPAYQADNFRLVFNLPRRELIQEDFRTTKIIVQSLAALQTKLLAAELEYERQKSVMPGQEVIVMQDADGNWLDIRERREIG
jgi:hypothetical protein